MARVPERGGSAVIETPSATAVPSNAEPGRKGTKPVYAVMPGAFLVTAFKALSLEALHRWACDAVCPLPLQMQGNAHRRHMLASHRQKPVLLRASIQNRLRVVKDLSGL